ncbi:hypothetical protein [Methanoplanus endosymbiosus]|nr:hypothetical protein [Methanoplanus endosymbiosus]
MLTRLFQEKNGKQQINRINIVNLTIRAVIRKNYGRDDAELSNNK